MASYGHEMIFEDLTVESFADANFQSRNIPTYDEIKLPVPTESSSQLKDDSAICMHTEPTFRQSPDPRKRKQDLGCIKGSTKTTVHLYELNENDAKWSKTMKKKIIKAKKSRGFRVMKCNSYLNVCRKLSICVKMLLSRGTTTDEIEKEWGTTSIAE